MSNTGDDIHSESGLWTFGGKTPSKFDEHVSKSVPLYFEGHDLICALAEFMVPSNGKVLHIGSSTGVLTNKIAKQLDSRNPEIIGLEIEKDMIKEALSRVNHKNIIYLNEDINNYELVENEFNLIVSYYTIQFVHPSLRQLLIDRIYRSLKWGGAFIMFEKVRGSDARFQDILNISYQDFKIKQGYTSTNILEKQKSLKSILEPFSRKGNIDMLNRAGFIDIETVQRYLCFEGFLSIK